MRRKLEPDAVKQSPAGRSSVRRKRGPRKGAILALATALTLPPLWAQEPAEPATPAQPAQEEQGDQGRLQLNFQNAPLSVVMDYVSRAAGFTILAEVPLTGTVDVVSHQGLDREGAVRVLHTLLAGQGYAVVQKEDVLQVIKRGDAPTSEIPVRSGNDPDEVPDTDEMVTQVIPILHTTAAELIDTLKPLMPESAIITANKDSNALVITDTSGAVRRLLFVITALDSTVSSILAIEVIPLNHADATETANIVNQVFERPTSSSQDDPRRRFFQRFGGGPFGGGPGGGEAQPQADSAAQETASHVRAVADTRGNAVVVTAPSQSIAQIRELVENLDVPTEADSLVRVFPLKYADAESMAQVIGNLYSDQGSGSQFMGMNRGPGGGRFPFPMPFAQPGQQTGTGSRALSETQVLAVADTRTNSVVVSASAATLLNVEEMVQELDRTPDNVPSVYVYRIKHADVTELTETLESMFDELESGTGTSGVRTNTNRGFTMPMGIMGGGTMRNTGGATRTTGGRTR
jgi:general secretion pathway protein D